ncbi:hypothetical protein I553_5234 [Mycobacterium xenopi 4042]|uniref:Uncharacterized protein n=1 Tax=Mycobacterium xenopi 4042 TaxID=1299334 RepID=X7ZYS7_MYCXE|nr:hypothetical protein I553_5234 [Mycobacterium xenopi 4042]
MWRTGATARLLLIALRALHRRRWAWWRGFFSSRCALCIVAAGLGGAASSHRAARSASSPLGLVARLLLIALRALHRRRWAWWRGSFSSRCALCIVAALTTR